MTRIHLRKKIRKKSEKNFRKIIEISLAQCALFPTVTTAYFILKARVAGNSFQIIFVNKSITSNPNLIILGENIAAMVLFLYSKFRLERAASSLDIGFQNFDHF